MGSLISVYEIFAVSFVRHVEKLHPQKSLNIPPDQTCQLDKFVISHCSFLDESLYEVIITKQKISKQVVCHRSLVKYIIPWAKSREPQRCMPPTGPLFFFNLMHLCVC